MAGKFTALTLFCHGRQPCSVALYVNYFGGHPMVANIAHSDKRINSAPAANGRGVYMNNIQALQEILENRFITPLFQPCIFLK